LPRYIATPETAKHRIFQFLDATIMPDHKLVCLAFNDAYMLGVVSSFVHVIWSLATGSRLGVGNDSVYVSSRCFQTFPFPDATLPQQARIHELAEQLDAHRKRQQAQYETLTLTDLYNVVEKLKAGEALTAKDQVINQQGLASVVLSLHQQLDKTVAEAYGWPRDLPDADILTRLVRLNQERASEEQAGHIRYLRPDYQAPGQQQMGIDLGITTTKETIKVEATGPQEWPKELAQQMQAVRTLVQQTSQPISAAQVASQFKRTKVDKVQPLLDTLAMLALLRLTPDGLYAA
ncbi:hypothetical protein LC612_42835, partial [Nostoc sp. CHAB 5834]|nr:hypothetical protein [Nostoc sp. CHAB 5834]